MIPFPPAPLVEGRRLPGNAETLRRLIRALELQPGDRVLLVGAAKGEALGVLAKEQAAQVTAYEWEESLVPQLEARIRDESLAGRVTLAQGELSALPRGQFHVVIVDAPPPKGSLTPFAQELRELLAVNGRLALTVPAAVGLSAPPAVTAFWTEELGMPLVRPVVLLGMIEKAGYEPIWAEALADDVMADYYRKLEARLESLEAAMGKRLGSAIELFRTGGGRTSATHVMLVARRREPGEKPPAARTAG